jgi:probable blue pigment (indigoidine) exporter
MTAASPDGGPASLAHRSLVPLIPGAIAATSLGFADVLSKIVLSTGCDVVTMLSIRGLFGAAFLAAWLRLGQKPRGDARVRLIAAGAGVLFGGVIFCLFKAIALIDISTAVLTYFAYPLLTGLLASLFGLDPLRWRGALCALVAFVGLAVMIGAHPAGLAMIGVAYGIGAALFRTAQLLVTRAWLVGADARLTTAYSLASSTALFLLASLMLQSWNNPQTALGWLALLGVSAGSTAGLLFIFISTVRIGPFRTALIMNLEPLTAMLLSFALLGETVTPMQGVGSAIMLAALVAFQLWR